jgi:diamine N-acetyltransferase
MIKGHNIYLRLLEKKDSALLYKIYNENDVRKYNIIPNDIQSYGIKLRTALGIINEENILVGFITYNESSYFKGVYYIGITIWKKYWGRNYGKDAIKTLLEYLFKELNAERVELEVIGSNLRAISCYKKCGFVEKEIKKDKVNINGNYTDTIIMRILKYQLSDI